MSDRLSRKEIKRQDTFQITMGRILDWIQTHRTHLVVGAVLLVAAVVAMVGWVIWVRTIEDDAQTRLTEAMEAYGAPIRGETEGAAAEGDGELSFSSVEARRERAAELFEGVVEDYGVSDAADVARVYLGEIAAVRGETERARELWREFLDEHPRHLLGAEVRLNLYALDRAEGRGEEVAGELRRMLDDDRRTLPEDVVLHELAVTLEELGREEEATEYYQRLVERFAQSPYALAARDKVGGSDPAGPLTGLGS